MEINRNNVMEVIQKSGLKPDKDYGQNYLLDNTISQKIIDLLEVEKGDSVLEIGPGLGSLSHYLCQHKDCSITLVDIDERMINFLKIIYQSPNVELVLSDIRKHDVSKYTKIVGNLPYNITTETIVYLLENAIKAERMVLMCQAEAFSRFFEVSGKDYGPVSILVHLLGYSKRNFTVKPGSFYPIPKCSSVVFTIYLDKTVDYKEALDVYDFSKKMFLNRRKTIYNNLSSFLGNKEEASSILSRLNVSPNKRPEELSPIDYKHLYDSVKSY